MLSDAAQQWKGLQAATWAGILAKGWVGSLGLDGRSELMCHSVIPGAFIFACELQQPPGIRSWRLSYLQVQSDLTHVTQYVLYTAANVARSASYNTLLLHGQPPQGDSYCCCRLGHHRRS